MRGRGRGRDSGRRGPFDHFSRDLGRGKTKTTTIFFDFFIAHSSPSLLFFSNTQRELSRGREEEEAEGGPGRGGEREKARRKG
jgi:hypothetical protein